MKFTKATKQNLFARLALIGASGGGKTYSGLKIATHLAQGKRVAVIDTERSSASKYSDDFDFDVIELNSFAPSLFREAIRAAVNAKQYGCLLIDSFSHAWMGKDGTLEFKDNIAQQSGKNSFTAWREAGSELNALVDDILDAPLHVIVTMRSKMVYVQEEDDRGKVVVRKVGLQPVQRDGLEYEFDLVGDMVDGKLIVGKTRCKALDKRAFQHPGDDFAGIFLNWLTSGATPEPEPTPAREYPKAEPAKPGPSPEGTAYFKTVCEGLNSNPREAAMECAKAMGVAGWNALSDAMLTGQVAKMLEDTHGYAITDELTEAAAFFGVEFPAAAPEPEPAATPEPAQAEIPGTAAPTAYAGNF